MIAELDADGDGCVDYDEFISAWATDNTRIKPADKDDNKEDADKDDNKGDAEEQ